MRTQRKIKLKRWLTAALAGLLSLLMLVGCAPVHSGGAQTSQPDTPPLGSQTPTEEVTNPITGAVTDPAFEPKSLSGRIVSQQSDSFALCADWTAVETEEGPLLVTVRVRLICWAISIGKKLGSVTVNGEKQNFSSPAVANTVQEQKNLPLASLTFEVEADEDGETMLDIEVVWDFDETYNGTEIGLITLSDRVPFPEGNENTAKTTSALQPNSEDEDVPS